MSTYWGLYCEACDQQSPNYYNHGDDWLQEYIDHWPAIQEVLGCCTALEVKTWADYEDVSPWDFLREHYDHGVVPRDEYGRTRDHEFYLTCYQCKQVAYWSDSFGDYVQACGEADCGWVRQNKIIQPP